ncbi:MAG: DUF2277 domain-containing protein [Chloroflexi bacterium]|jgi:hypothetical protein|nr:DUF2277 domain-containing protein [Chloroflexota bacterium]
MCRSIVSLRRPDGPASDEEVRAAALQFVRKVSGYRVPSRRNEVVFEQAVNEVAAAARRLLDGVGASAAGSGPGAPAAGRTP